jgi:hypothetical protein
MVVTEIKTPIRALARASVNETTPTIPARTATTIENKFGLSMRLETGRTPSEYNFGVWPDQRITKAKSRVTIIAAENPASRASRPRIIGRLARLSMPREYGVGGPGPYVELHGVAARLPGSAGEHEKIRDADVGGEGLDEVVGAVRQADQAYMKGHCRSTPGRPL